MASSGMARISASTASAPAIGSKQVTDGANPVILQSSDERIALQRIVAELNRGFDLVQNATVSRQSHQPFDSEQSIKSARAACEMVKSLLSDVSPAQSAGLQMRLDCLRSILFDLSNEGVRVMHSPGPV